MRESTLASADSSSLQVPAVVVLGDECRFEIGRAHALIRRAAVADGEAIALAAVHAHAVGVPDIDTLSRSGATPWSAQALR